MGKRNPPSFIIPDLSVLSGVLIFVSGKYPLLTLKTLSKNFL